MRNLIFLFEVVLVSLIIINICLPQKLVCYSLGYWTSIIIKYVNNSNQLPFFIINFFPDYTILKTLYIELYKYCYSLEYQ